MTAIISSAREAITIADELLGKKDLPKDSHGHVQERKVSHWSHYVLLLGAVAGGLAAIVAGIMALWALMSFSIILFVTNTIGAYYIKKFETYSDLEDYVNALTVRIKEFAKDLKSLNKIDNDIKKTDHDLEQTMDKGKKIWDAEEKKIRKDTDDLEKVTNQLEQTQLKLRQVEGLYQDLLKELGLFTSDFTKDNNVLGEKVTGLASVVSQQSKVVSDLKDRDGAFEGRLKQYKQLNDSQGKFLQQFRQEISQISALSTKIEKLKKEQEETLKKLEKENAVLRKALDDAIAVGKEGKDLQASLQVLIKTLNQKKKSKK